jgi:hypothetical protein
MGFIFITYEPIPTPLTAAQLNQKPLDGSDTAAEIVAIILPTLPIGSIYDMTAFLPWQGQEATTWTQNGVNFQTIFNLNNIISSNGKGVYTLILIDNTGEMFFTNYSIWV